MNTTTPFLVETENGEPIRANTPAWLRRRSTGIGASEAPSILGLSPYDSPRDVYLRKVSDIITDEQTEAMEFGHRLEPVILETVRDRHGNPDDDRHRYLGQIEKSPGLMRSIAYPHLLASLDAIVVEPDGTRAPLNAKNVSVYRRKSFEAGEYGVPDDIAVQVFQEAIVAGTDHGYVAPFFGNTMPEPIRLDVPPEFAEWYIEESRRFWLEHVAARVEPAPTLIDDLDDIWHAVAGETKAVNLSPEAIAAAREHRRLKDEVIKPAEQIVDELALIVKTELGDATEGWDTESAPPRLAVTWRQNRPSAALWRLDESLLLADHPELADLLAGYRFEVERKAARPFLSK